MSEVISSLCVDLCSIYLDNTSKKMDEVTDSLCVGLNRLKHRWMESLVICVFVC